MIDTDRSPPEFPLASPYSSIVHHLSGPNSYALTQIHPKTSGSVDGALPPIVLLDPLTATHPQTSPSIFIQVATRYKSFQR
ncbi:hypothetical protein DM02DRAFT_700751 [Periconia macrospinosa]|uniref:Uncharacterized protein n=1 Tax=Periconia macrospinosa TaxID=97972 RepID=A0A2V1EAS0_9PLEO|nr:hypothetical protein DM02DRAFT_700751 [Periconia macrospinosa]